ncbi:MAG: hypothetical protein ACPHO4_15860, partial [Longimicrobiales bacterium]
MNNSRPRPVPSRISGPLLSLTLACGVVLGGRPGDLVAQSAQLEDWKSQLVSFVQERRDFTADMVDQIFSYGELG